MTQAAANSPIRLCRSFLTRLLLVSGGLEGLGGTASDFRGGTMSSGVAEEGCAVVDAANV
jgi:hypothetical protein